MGKIRRLVFMLIILALAIISACNNKEKRDPELRSSQVDTLSSLNDTLVIEPIEADQINNQGLTEIDYPKLSVIIDDFGNYNNFMLDSLLVKFGTLPSEVAFAILPNLPYSEFVMEYFQFTNRELLLHTPMEPLNSKINAGDVVISSSDDAIDIVNKLGAFYNALPQVKGLNNHMGSRATENSEVMAAVLSWCKENNLFFVDSATTSKSIAFNLAKEIGIPTAKRDIFLDVPNASKENVDKYLVKMNNYFKAGRDILVITHASTLERRDNLQYFIDEAKKIGYLLVPVSEYLTYPQDSILPDDLTKNNLFRQKHSNNIEKS